MTNSLPTDSSNLLEALKAEFGDSGCSAFHSQLARKDMFTLRVYL